MMRSEVTSMDELCRNCRTRQAPHKTEKETAEPDKSAPMVGRAGEIFAIEKALDTLRTRSQFLQIAGAPGTGKSLLLHELCERAADRGYRTCVGVAPGARTRTPLGMIIDALDEEVANLGNAVHELVAADVHCLAAVFPSLGARTNLYCPPAQSRQLHHALRQLLERLAQPTGLVIAFDDAHRCDPLSAAFLAYLARHPPRTPVLVALAYRSTRTGLRLAGVLDRANTETQLRIEPKPLGDADAEALLPPGLCPIRREILKLQATGVPGLLQVVVPQEPEEDCGADIYADPHPILPARPLVDLDALSPAAYRLACIAAVLGDPFATRTLAKISGTALPDAFTAIDELRDEGIIHPADQRDWYCFAHPAIQAEVRQASPAALRYAAHSELVTAWRCGSAVGVARHLEHLGVGNSEEARQLIDGAVENMFDQPARASRWLRAAMEGAGEEQATYAGIEMAKALAVSGRFTESAQQYMGLWTDASELPDDVRADAAEWFVRALLMLGADRDAGQLLHAEFASSRDTLGLRLQWAGRLLCLGQLGDEHARLLEKPVGYNVDGVTRAHHLSLLAAGSFLKGAPDEAAHHSLTAADILEDLSDDACAPSLDALYWLAWIEQRRGLLAQAAEHLARGFRISVLRGLGYRRTHFALGLTRVSLAAGNHVAAQRHFAYAMTDALRSRSRLLHAEALTLQKDMTSLAPLPDESWISPADVRSVTHNLLGLGATIDESDATAPADDALISLSQRERQIARLVSMGHTNQYIARNLQLSHKTVETYLSRMFKKLGVGSRSQVAHLVGRMRVIQDPP